MTTNMPDRSPRDLNIGRGLDGHQWSFDMMCPDCDGFVEEDDVYCPECDAGLYENGGDSEYDYDDDGYRDDLIYENL